MTVEDTRVARGYSQDRRFTRDGKDGKSKCDASKIVIYMSIIAIIISVISAIVVTTMTQSRADTLSNEAQISRRIFAVENIGKCYEIGGFEGWYYRRQYPDFYGFGAGFPSIYAKVGDCVVFKSRIRTNENVWRVTNQTFETCNFTIDAESEEYNAELETRNGIRVSNNEEGFRYIITPQDGETGILYFATQYRWDQSSGNCKKGVKIKVYVEPLTELKISTGAYNIKWLLKDNDDDSEDDEDDVVVDGSTPNIDTSQTIQDLKASIAKIGRVLILNQFSNEQRVRTEGQSGLTNVRGRNTGDYAYHDGSYSNGAAASIHNHADTIRVVGIGEIEACLNGVCFQTRHNDYNLNMASNISTNYHATQPVPQPDVPEEVLNAGNVTEQIAEMQEWFRAFKNQDHSVRDYRKYFKPILCVLEGTYILETNDLDDAFDSDRHQIDAKTWESLHNKIMWMSNSGRKNSAENLAHLPGVLRFLANDTWPVLSNWEYRIICAPLKNDIPTSRFKIADDLHIQIQSSPKTREELYFARRARFKLNTYINLNNLDDHRWSPSRRRWNYLDYLMEQVPGKDNFGCQITDAMPNGAEETIHYNSKQTNIPLNSCFYSRYYQLLDADAMGASSHRRSYSDQYMFAAQTTQAKVSPIQFDFEIENDDGVTVDYYPTISKWSYAIPLEIIYLTPLHQWNPYNIVYDESSNPEEGGRTGICSQGKDRALMGANRANYFRTPVEFFASTEAQSAADTSGGGTCVIDSSNTVREVRASGHWISFPEIGGGVGDVRQRYPIFPIHEAGSATWKELKALQQIVLSDGYDDITSEDLSDFFGPLKDIRYGFSLLVTGGGHQHDMYIPGHQVKRQWYNETSSDFIYFETFNNNFIKEDTEWRNGHTHTLNVSRKWDSSITQFVYKINHCRFGDLQDEDIGYMDNACSDGHIGVQRN